MNESTVAAAGCIRHPFPRVPAAEEIRGLVAVALRHVPAERLWANPDCGLKTRGQQETERALAAMVAGARGARAALPSGAETRRQ